MIFDFNSQEIYQNFGRTCGSTKQNVNLIRAPIPTKNRSHAY